MLTIPFYYKIFGSFDIFDLARDAKLNFPLGSALKYIIRAGKKDPDTYVQDLEKAFSCIKYEIDQSKWEQEQEFKKAKKEELLNICDITQDCKTCLEVDKCDIKYRYIKNKDLHENKRIN